MNAALHQTVRFAAMDAFAARSALAPRAPAGEPRACVPGSAALDRPVDSGAHRLLSFENDVGHDVKAVHGLSNLDAMPAVLQVSRHSIDRGHVRAYPSDRHGNAASDG